MIIQIVGTLLGFGFLVTLTAVAGTLLARRLPLPRTKQEKAYELACSYGGWEYSHREGDNMVLSRYVAPEGVRAYREIALITPEGGARLPGDSPDHP